MVDGSWAREVPIPFPALIERLRADLIATEYTVAAVEAFLGPVASAALAREQPLAADRVAAASDDPLGALVRLFILGRAVPASLLSRALPTLGVHEAVRMGIVCPVGAGYLRAMCDLVPHADDLRDYWLASDLSEFATGTALRADHVLGGGGASATLASWTIRRPVARALDVGTGCGIQVLHLAGHAGSITATDISVRALGFARFNFALNDIEATLVLGDMLEPVRGRQFDLVVSNPPFVITPRSGGHPTIEYRDGGLAGDALVHRLMRTVGDLLAPGGVAQFLGNWEVPAGSSFDEVVSAWVNGLGLDAWVIQRATQDPAEYAELWVRDGGVRSGTSRYDEMYAGWLDDFASRDVAQIGFGVVTLHRPLRPRPVWIDLEDLPTPVGSAVGAEVADGLDMRNWLADNGIDGLLATRWCIADDVTIERTSLGTDPEPAAIVARRGSPLRRSVRLDAVSAGLLSVCDGVLTAAQALTAIATLLGVDLGSAIEGSAPVIRRLVADGFIRRADV